MKSCSCTGDSGESQEHQVPRPQDPEEGDGMFYCVPVSRGSWLVQKGGNFGAPPQKSESIGLSCGQKITISNELR